jgi:hypothetical protein
MSKTKINNPKWQCPICGDIRYVTIESEFDRAAKKWVSKYCCCKGCSIVFNNPHKFNKVRFDAEGEGNLIIGQADIISYDELVEELSGKLDISLLPKETKTESEP